MNGLKFSVTNIQDTYVEITCFGLLVQTNAFQDILNLARRLSNCGVYAAILDLNGLRNVDAAGATAVMSMLQNFRDLKIVFVCKNRRIVNFFKSLSLGNHLPLYHCRAEALKSPEIRKILLRYTDVFVMPAEVSSPLSQLSSNGSTAMLDIFGKPMIDRLLDELEAHGIRNVNLPVRSGADPIIDHFQRRPRKHQTITYFHVSEWKQVAGVGHSYNTNYLQVYENCILPNRVLARRQAVSHPGKNNFEKDRAFRVLHSVDRLPLNPHDGSTQDPSCGLRYSYDQCHENIHLSPRGDNARTCGGEADFRCEMNDSELAKARPLHTVSQYFALLNELSEQQIYHSEFNQIEEFLWVGQNVELGKRLDNDGPLYVGDNTEVGNNCSFVGVNFLSQDIRVGNYVAIQNSAVGPSTTISDRDFVVNQIAFRSGRYFHQTRTSVSSSHPDQDFRKLSAV